MTGSASDLGENRAAVSNRRITGIALDRRGESGDIEDDRLERRIVHLRCQWRRGSRLIQVIEWIIRQIGGSDPHVMVVSQCNLLQ